MVVEFITTTKIPGKSTATLIINNRLSSASIGQQIYIGNEKIKNSHDGHIFFPQYLAH
jgi:hypothetical protein